MTTAVGAPPPHRSPADQARDFLTGAVVGATLSAFISGCVVQSVALVVLGLVLLPVYGLVFLLLTVPRRAREAAVVPRTALAMIESLEAVGGEGSDIPVRFDLTVAPDDERGFRVEILQDINLVNLPDYRPRGIVVVEYPPDRPWKARIVKRPTPTWEERAASASLDSVPGPAMKRDSSPASGAGCLLTFLGLLLGAGAILGLFHTEVFSTKNTDSAASSGSSGSSSSSSTTTTTTTTIVTSGVGTVALGQGQSMLDPGELRTAVESVTKGAPGRQALTVIVQDSQLTVAFAPSTLKTGAFDPGSLPCDQIPALVRQAEHAPGVGSVQSWQVTAEGLTSQLTLRVVVTGSEGTGTLVADGQGKVLQRSGG